MIRKWIPRLAWDMDGHDLDNWGAMSKAERDAQEERLEIVREIAYQTGSYTSGQDKYDLIWETIPGSPEVERFETAVLERNDELILKYFMQMIDILDQAKKKSVKTEEKKDKSIEPTNWFEAEELPNPSDVYRDRYYPNRTNEEEALERITNYECSNTLDWEDYQWYRMLAPDSKVLELFQKAVAENNELAITMGAIFIYEDLNKVDSKYSRNRFEMQMAYFLFPNASKYGALQKYAKLCKTLPHSQAVDEYRTGVEYGYERTDPKMLKILACINADLEQAGFKRI